MGRINWIKSVVRIRNGKEFPVLKVGTTGLRNGEMEFLVIRQIYNSLKIRRVTRMRNRKINEWEIRRDEAYLSPLSLFTHNYWFILRLTKNRIGKEKYEETMRQAFYAISEELSSQIDFSRYLIGIAIKKNPMEAISKIVNSQLFSDLADSYINLWLLSKENNIDFGKVLGNVEGRIPKKRELARIVKEPSYFTKFSSRYVTVTVNDDDFMEKVAGVYRFKLNRKTNIPERIRIYGVSDKVVGESGLGVFPFLWYPKGIIMFTVRIYIPKKTEKFIDYSNPERFINIGIPYSFRRSIEERYFKSPETMGKFLMLFLLDKKKGYEFEYSKEVE